MINEIPYTLTTKELPQYVRCGQDKWRELRNLGLAPEPKFRCGDGDVYLGADIKRFLGILDETKQETHHDPFKKGLLGRNKK